MAVGGFVSVGRVCTSGLLIGPQLMLADSLTKDTCDVCMNTRQVIYAVGGFVVCVMSSMAKLPKSEAETEVLANEPHVCRQP